MSVCENHGAMNSNKCRSINNDKKRDLFLWVCDVFDDIENFNLTV